MNSIQPINITSTDVQGNCDLKCSYNFRYSESSLTAKNSGVLIGLSYENSSVPPVIYNQEKYSVENIKIVAPSLHLFDGAKVDAEIIIEHSPEKGGLNLSVAIPIVASSETSTASNLITQVIEGVANGAPTQGETTTLNISGFTLQDIVPVEPFYTYTGKENDWIVFGKENYIPLSSDTISTLSQIITPFNLPTFGKGLYYNSKGPNNKLDMGGIYISCQPTGASEEETPVEYDKDEVRFDIFKIFTDPNSKSIVQFIVAFIIILAVFLVLNVAYKAFTGGEIKIPNISNGIMKK